jgi:dimethylhistidine N-methyltransferase
LARILNAVIEFVVKLSCRQNINDQAFLHDVLAGLNHTHKQLPCKYFYDHRGSQLFEEICRLDEYYLTRAESEIIHRYADEMAYQLGSRVMLLEFGSGSSIKTRILLDRLDDPVAYVPIDISREHLINTADSLRRDYPRIEILPVVADFTQPFILPTTTRTPSHRAVFFPGSTIGNLRPAAAKALLTRMAEMVGENGGMLVGIDLQKDVAVLEAAYNDAKGITAEFNLNLLERINSELGANFIVDRFCHRAIYNSEHHRIEMYLISCRDQTVRINGHQIEFRAGERILTEYSHKYTIEGFASMAATAGGFSLHRSWTDNLQRFAVVHLVREARPHALRRRPR